MKGDSATDEIQIEEECQIRFFLFTWGFIGYNFFSQIQARFITFVEKIVWVNFLHCFLLAFRLGKVTIFGEHLVTAFFFHFYNDSFVFLFAFFQAQT